MFIYTILYTHSLYSVYTINPQGINVKNVNVTKDWCNNINKPNRQFLQENKKHTGCFTKILVSKKILGKAHVVRILILRYS